MIDASRLSHSLATALKDRPHGIPVQPNRSLPLRPPPPLPVRISLAKSPKNSSITHQTTGSKKEKNEDYSIKNTKRSKKHGNMTNDVESENVEAVGMNFYDSKGEEDSSNDMFGENFYSKIPENLSKYRYTKSLDNDNQSDESNCGDKRRKSLEHGVKSRRDVDSFKRRNIADSESPESDTKIVQNEKERRSSVGKKRKPSSEEDPLVFERAKSPRIDHIDEVNLFHSVKLKTGTKDVMAKSKNSNGVVSSGNGLQTTHKYFNSESTSPPLADERNTNSSVDDSNWKQTSSNTYRLILPKPANIPKCPAAIPIEVAHALNQGSLRNSNIGTGRTENQIGNVAPMKNQCDSMETDKTYIPETVEDIENSLPSMPSLEDLMHGDGRQGLTLRGNRADIGKVESNITAESVPMARARVLQVTGDPTTKTNGLNVNELIKENANPIQDTKLNKPHDSIGNLTTVLKIQIPGRSPELIILQAPQMMANGDADSIAENSPVEATTPVSLYSGIQPALEDLKETENSMKINKLTELREYRKENHNEYQNSREKIAYEKDTVQINFPNKLSGNTDPQRQCEDLSGKDEPQYILQHKSPVEFEIRLKETSDSQHNQDPVQECQEDECTKKKRSEITKDAQGRPKKEDILRCRKNRLSLKLLKLHEEEANLKYKMSQTSDPSVLKRLQQKINCAAKKIENTHKYLNKLGSIENQELCAAPAPFRIQVRQDLVKKIPSPACVEPPPQSPLRPTTETDKASTRRSSPVLPPAVIIISESDSANESDNERNFGKRKSPENIEPFRRTERKIEDEDDEDDHDEDYQDGDDDMPDNDTGVASSTVIVFPDDKANNCQLETNSGMVNNNVEYSNKNLPEVREDIPVTLNTTSISIPRVSASPKSDSVNISPDLTDKNTASISIPQVLASPNNASMSASKISSSGRTAPPNIPPLIRDPINFSPSHSNGAANQKSPSIHYGALSLNSSPDKVNERGREPSCNCSACLRSKSAVTTNNAAEFDDMLIPSVVSDLRTPNTLRRTAMQENTNVPSVPNYPVHRTDYASTGNSSSMFSRNNGGANINLSSPLQGHSAVPVPPPYHRNLTAQGYPMPTESSSNQQTAQWHNKPSIPFTPDQNGPAPQSILASHLLKSQAQESAQYANSIKLSSLTQSKATTKANPAAQPIDNRIMTAQFPTLGNWAAQMSRESVMKKPVSSPSADGTGYKTTGSDMYKMTATVVNDTNPITVANTIQWPPGRLCPEQPKPQSYPSQRNIPQTYRTDYPPNPQIPQNSRNGPVRYPGSEVFIPYPYNQVASGPQNTRSTEYSSGQTFQRQQNPPKYQPPNPTMRKLLPRAYPNQENTAQIDNSIGIIPQQYIQQQQPYVQATYAYWPSANNYQKHYINHQYNGYNLQSHPIDNNYRPMNKNLAPMQPQQQQQQQRHDNMPRELISNFSNAKLPSPMYNMPGNLNAVTQNGRSVEPLDLGRSYVAPHLGKVHKSLDSRTNTLKCSWCGMPGPKFNCLDCETAFYCNEQCQAQHWGEHYIECPKKMPKLKKVS